MNRTCYALAALALLILAGPVTAGIKLNELFVNPPGGDNGFEFIEFLSDAASESMNGLTLVVIDGDGTSAGAIDVAISLDGFSTGTNQLHLRRDSATLLVPNPDPATVVSVLDFAPDLENGSNTFLLVTGFTGALALDLDTNNDGTVDVALPWISVIDGIGVLENDGVNNFQYADDVGMPFFAANDGFTPDALVRLVGGSWISMDVLGTAPGPFAFALAENQDLDGNQLDVVNQLTFGNLSPGSDNPSLVPEPSTLVLAAFGGLAVAVLARRNQRSAGRRMAKTT